jgi:hypothetical protein
MWLINSSEIFFLVTQSNYILILELRIECNLHKGEK